MYNELNSSLILAISKLDSEFLDVYAATFFWTEYSKASDFFAAMEGRGVLLPVIVVFSIDFITSEETF